MKARLALVVGLILLLIGVSSLVALGQTGTIDATIPLEFTATMPIASISFSGQEDQNGVTLGKYLEVSVHSNVTYTVQIGCDGNLQLVGFDPIPVNEIETEYAIWKHIRWYDWHSQQQGATDEAYGWVSGTNHAAFGPDPFYYDAHVAPDIDYPIQGGNNGFAGMETLDTDAVYFGLDTAPVFLPEHSADFVWWYEDTYTGTWLANWYNHGADLTLRFYPFLDIYEHYGTRAGSYTGTITVVVTNVNTTVP